MNRSFAYCGSLKNVPLLDTSNVVWMNSTFKESAIETLPLLDTSKVTEMVDMMYRCMSLKQVPLLDTSSVTDTREMFYQCLYVESGALAMYNQMANQTNPPTYHSSTFYNCGSWTTTGRAELEQIPEDWKQVH
jgi:hypothetical protein